MKDFFINKTPKQKAVIGAAVIALLALGWNLYSNITSKPQITKEIPLVRTVTIGDVTTSNTNTYPGEVRGRYESNLAFQVSGKINSRHINIGDKVSAGQILMTIDPKDISQSVEANSAQLASAVSNQKLAADNAARYNTLYQNGAVSQAVADQYNTQLEAANAALRQAQAQFNASSNQLEYTNLRSDADGVVANITGEVGQVAAAGTPLVTVVKNGEREVQIYVPENKLASIQNNQKAVVNFWALQNVNADGYISEIAPMADPVTKTYRVRVAIENMPPEASLGMTAKVVLHNGKNEAIIIPASAIYQINNQPQVWLVRDKHVQAVDVTIGNYIGNNVTITYGLQDGDIVVTGGVNKLTDKQEVRLMESGDAK